MSLPIRRFAPIAAGTLAIALAAGTALLALAHDGPHSGPKNCETPAADVGGEGPFLAENDAAMKKMMSGMAARPTGDVDGDFVASVQESVDLEKTLFIVSSKSGGTVETLSHYRHFASAGQAQQFVVDHRSRQSAGAPGLGGRPAPHVPQPPDIGGRYSVLSDVRPGPRCPDGRGRGGAAARRAGGRAGLRALRLQRSPTPGCGWGRRWASWPAVGRDKLTFIVSPPIDSFGLWVEQLVAESTGKHGRGILPVADEPLGEPDVYGDDRVFVYLRDGDSADEDVDAAVDKLAAAGHPTITLATHGPADLGRIFFLSEFAVAVAGWALEINPFDQPNVQEAKDNTKRVLDSGAVPDLPAADDDALRALLSDAAPPHYVAIMGYLPYSEETRGGRLRAASGHPQLTGAAVTFGYGPRFLHSTGPAPQGRSADRALPAAHQRSHDGCGRSPGAAYSFGTLIAAQAAGDLQTLRDHGLSAERVKLEGDPAAGGAGADRADHRPAVGRRMTAARRAARSEDNPLVEGLERLPVHADHAGHLWRHRRPGPPQAPARALQPGP